LVVRRRCQEEDNQQQAEEGSGGGETQRRTFLTLGGLDGARIGGLPFIGVGEGGAAGRRVDAVAFMLLNAPVMEVVAA
jgi:hypothetical protein